MLLQHVVVVDLLSLMEHTLWDLWAIIIVLLNLKIQTSVIVFGCSCYCFVSLLSVDCRSSFARVGGGRLQLDDGRARRKHVPVLQQPGVSARRLQQLCDQCVYFMGSLAIIIVLLN